MGRSGDFIQTSEKHSYRYFSPAPLPPNPKLDMNEVSNQLADAMEALGRLNMLSEMIPDMPIFLYQYIRKEAVLSSQIEGTQATLEDILDPEIAENTEKLADVEEIVNYIAATNYALELQKKLPLSCRFLREIHMKLMEGVRGQEKNPGEFRHSQNWIGPQGSTIATAKYVPPTVTVMDDALNELEKYIHSSDTLHPLIQAGLIHYQFETIHPFLDGNGRVGRLLIILFLLEKRVIQKPILYISLELKRNQYEYYDRMMAVRNTGNYEQWINFFLEVVTHTAQNAVNKIEQLSDLIIVDRGKIINEHYRSDTVKNIYEFLLSQPLVTVNGLVDYFDIGFVTINKAIKQLEGLGIVVQTSRGKRNRVFSYKSYLKILEDDTLV
ncbi:Fic family protein [Enterococcus raffinosus]|uniref:Fic family protein n=1 Tax=Enterococcus raffinosus TaxID=71452 RepID=UPI001C10D920|nr:Fic family protein [Enterococcus raffinosus]MBU5361658.1 Fic family protein [Enterococcus raffinosus]